MNSFLFSVAICTDNRAGVIVTFLANLFFACEKEDRSKIKSLIYDVFRVIGMYMNKRRA